MLLLKNLISFFNYLQTDKIDKNTFQSLPFHFYCKDSQGKYLDANICQAQDAGLAKELDMVGHTDIDLYWGNYGASFMKNDQEVILTKNSKIFVESTLIYKDQKRNAISYKTPLRNSIGKVIGITGVSLILNTDNIIFDCYHLSKRQRECLFFLVRGKSDKEIAKILDIGPRTVESYVNEIKYKMNCFSRAQIIEKVFNEVLIEWSLPF